MRIIYIFVTCSFLQRREHVRKFLNVTKTLLQNEQVRQILDVNNQDTLLQNHLKGIIESVRYWFHFATKGTCKDIFERHLFIFTTKGEKIKREK